ncbi:SGNH/GDSL hydrolase family protein, partial [Klebsiella oxytoca]|nr:SGNH/GDSL hydrolase family protein [Klebsiella oxytoca]ELT9979593.1 SGNH/GDSL hydrolase family protein [Klebsiella oxytoca]
MSISDTQQAAQFSADAAVSAAEAKQYLLEAQQGYQDTSEAAQEAKNAAESASSSEQNAATSEANALQSATEASAARDEAVVAASTAAEFGDNKFTFYRTSSDPDGTIAGLAATTNGQSFRVAQGVDGTDAFITYQNDNGVAVAQAAQPGTAAITGTVREFSTLSLAENDVAAGNILDGSKCWVANASDITLADEYINNAGTLQPTGRKMPSQETINAVFDFISKFIVSGDVSDNYFPFFTDGADNVPV